MRISRIKLLALVVVLTVMIAGWRGLTSTSPVTLTVVNRFPRDREDGSLSRHDEWRDGFEKATLVLSNTSRRPIRYWGLMDATNVEYRCVLREAGGRHDDGVSSGLSLRSYTLPPARAVTFTVYLLSTRPCKVAVDYEDGRPPSKMQKLLPGWITRRIPWCQRQHTVATEELNPGN
jgi:hypothetical protein